ncbi:hypothetical protein AAY473_006095 [Plecturocebus cupreus]
MELLTTETSTIEPPTMESSTMETSTIEPPTMESSTMETSTIEPPTMESSTMETSTIEPPTMESSTMETSTIEPPTMESSTMETSTIEPPTMEASTMETSTIEPPTMGPSTMESLTTESSMFLAALGSSDSPASATQVAGITGTHHHTWLIFVFLVEMGFHHGGQSDLELLTSAYLSPLYLSRPIKYHASRWSLLDLPYLTDVIFYLGLTLSPRLECCGCGMISPHRNLCLLGSRSDVSRHKTRQFPRVARAKMELHRLLCEQ